MFLWRVLNQSFL